MKNKLLLLFVCISTFAFAQIIPENVKPPSWKLTDQFSTDLTPFELPAINVKSLKAEDAINDQDKSKPWRFGKEIYVDHDASEFGEWTTLPNGDKIWRMVYHAEGALTLNFMFDVFWIPEGSKLYVYNNDKTDIIRPFTHHNNNPEEVLGTWYVKGDQAWIEYHQPASVQGTPKLTVGAVVHGYRTIAGIEKALNDSGPCNHDVDCDITPLGADPHNINQKKEDVKAANAFINLGGAVCSGTLVNNTSNDQTPYFLTANHCGGGEGFWSFRFNWRSPNPSCGTFANSTDSPINQTVSGSVFRASSSQSDMKLVEITDPSFFTTTTDLVWAGWNRSTTQTPDVNFGIHHPAGDIQKVCRDDQGATRTVFNFNGNPNTQMWRIEDWDLGVTEGGSSGSALYNEEGLIIGMLSGGAAACSGTNDNGQFDVYGRFGVAWDFGTSASSRLSDWLDPGNTGVMTLGQFPPLETFDIDASISISELGLDNCSGFITPTITITNLGNNAITTATINYNVNSGTDTTINWSGNLNNGESDTISLPQLTLQNGANTFNVELINPNGQADDQPSNNTSSQAFDFTGALCSSVANTQFETSTTGVEFNTISNLNTGKPSGYSDYTSISTNVNRESSYDLSVYANSDGNYQIITYAWIDWNQNCSFDEEEQYDLGTSANINNVLTAGSPLSITVPSDAALGSTVMRITTKYTNPNANQFPTSCENNHDAEVEDYTVIVEPSLSIEEYNLSSIKVYPNPVTDELNIQTQNLSEALNYEVVNALGQRVKEGKLSINALNRISLSELSNGIYFIKLSSTTSSLVHKIIKE